MPEGSDANGNPSPLIDCDLPLGRAGLTVHNELVLSGWAASPRGIAGVAVQIGERQWNAAYGLDSPRLARELPNVPGGERAGYRLDIDTSSWEPGVYYVTVAAFDAVGGRAAFEGAVECRPFEAADLGVGNVPVSESEGLALSLDSPPAVAGASEVVGPLEVSGWAHSAEGVEAVTVTLDERLQYEALRPVARPDLLDRLGPDAAEAGFALRIDPVECPPGRHRLAVVAIGCDGGTAGVEREIVCRPVPADAGAVEWMPERDAPRRRDGSPAGAHAGAPDERARMWESRALLAEADEAASRAQLALAQAAQLGSLRSARALAAHARWTEGELVRVQAEHAASAHALQSLERSLSWRLTHPLRRAKRALVGRDGR